MENFFLFLATSIILRIPSPKFKRYLIGQSGCSSLLLPAGKTLHVKFTREGDKIYFNDHSLNAVTYGLICVQMKDVHHLPQAEKILVQYINKARRPFSAILNTGMIIEKQQNIISISDYWQDSEGIDWKIKGYTNGKVVSVLYVKNITEVSIKDHDGFLNGFRF